MKKLWFYLLIILCGSDLLHVYASGFEKIEGIQEFPIQPNFSDTIWENWVHPEKKYSLDGGRVFRKYGRKCSSVLHLNDLDKHLGIQINLDYPFGHLTRSIGLEFIFFVPNSEPINTSMICPNNEYNQFIRNSLRSLEILGFSTIKWNISFLGNVAFLIMPKLGIHMLPGGIEQDISHRSYNVGGITGIGVAINWYPWEWIGGFLETDIKYHYMLSYALPGVPDRHKKGSYSFYTYSFTGGFKSNF